MSKVVTPISSVRIDDVVLFIVAGVLDIPLSLALPYS
jgi:hypothetical protein